MTNTVSYRRVSSDQQAGEDRTSLRDQDAAIEKLAASLGRVVGKRFKDDGVSGATAEKRQGLMDLVAFCKANRRPSIDGLVLVLNTSRFGRFEDPDEAGHWRTVLRKAGWIVRYCEHDDAQDVTTRHLMRAIHDASATSYRTALRENVTRGKRGSAAQGFWGGREPFGYRRKVVIGGKPRVLEPGERKANVERVKLTPHEQEARVVRDIFAWYASGKETLRSIARRLSAKGRTWSRMTLRDMLSNPVYVGDITRNRHGEVVVVATGAHPALVSREVFTTVQHKLRQNSEAPRRAASQYVLSGLLRCADCSAPLIGGGWHGKPPAEIRQYYAEDTTRHACPPKLGMVAKVALEGAVVNLLASEFEKPAVRLAVEEAIDSALAASVSAGVDNAAAAKKRLAAIELERNRVVSAIAREKITDEDAAPILRALRLEAAELKAIEVVPLRPIAADERARALAVARDFPALARRLSGPDLRSLVAPWIAGGTYDKNTRRLVLNIRRIPSGLLSDSLKRDARKLPVVRRSVVVPKVPRRRFA